MSLKSFENYAHLATNKNIDNTETSGRYSFQASEERNILPDVIRKLSINANDALLEVGCGPGNLLIPLSFLVKSSAGNDNEPVLNRMQSRCGNSDDINILPGNFLTLKLPEKKFSKILIYSVLHCLADEDAAHEFVKRALSLLQPGGKLLIGDLPNNNKKDRFLKTALGKEVSQKWGKDVGAAGDHPMSALPNDNKLLQFDDKIVLSMLNLGRQEGFESYLLAQPTGLPFCHSREDILYVAAG